VVNHWATWCIPCVEEVPALRALHAALGQEVDMFGISWDMFDPRGDEDDIQEHVENFAVGHSVGWPSLIIEGRIKPESFFAAFELSYDKIPQTWVVSPEGLVVRRVNGALDAAGGQELRAFIEQQLKGA
jgi:thiol-disulfide isomerase/thioredoxin